MATHYPRTATRHNVSNWICLVRLADLLDGATEHKRLKLLLDFLPDESVSHLLDDPSVEALIGIEPPLESIVSSKYERLDEERARNLIETVRSYRESDPKSSVSALTEILKRIRNRRAHGFKTPDGPRDEEILGNAAEILRVMVLLAADELERECVG